MYSGLSFRDALLPFRVAEQDEPAKAITPNNRHSRELEKAFLFI
jgi:hypothetical protein